jgi:hypothetical protein
MSKAVNGAQQREWLLRGLIAPLAIPALAGLMRAALIVPLRVSLDPNEGWNAYHALSVLNGGRLYPSPASLMVNNYPPLSFYLVAALSHLTGDVIIAGRALSLIGVIGIGAGIAVVLRIARCTMAESILAVLFFTAALFLFSDYIGMDDPQLFAQALQIGGLALLLWRPRNDAAAVTAGLLFAATLFFKHNLFVLALAAALWLAVFDLRRALILAMSGGIAIALGLLAFRYAYGVSLFAILAAPRSYSLSLLSQNLRDWLVWAGLPLAATIVLCLTQYRDRYVVFCAIYAALSVATGALFCGGAGVDVNVLFDADIALALGFGLARNRLAPNPAKTIIVSAAFLVPLVFGAVSAAKDAPITNAGFWLHPLEDEAALSRRDIAFLASHRGPALCETLALCFWAGKVTEVDVFNIGEQYRLHARSGEPLKQKIASKAFGVIEFDALSPFPLTPGIRAALLQRYRIDHTDDNGAFLVPR